MGTYAENTRTRITLDLNKLRQGYLNRTPEFAALMEASGTEWSNTFQEICHEMAFESRVDLTLELMTITWLSGECKIGWQDACFAAMAPFAQEGDYAEFHCREYGTWRYILHGGKFIEQQGTVKVEYPPLPTLDRVKMQTKSPKRAAKRG